MINLGSSTPNPRSLEKHDAALSAHRGNTAAVNQQSAGRNSEILASFPTKEPDPLFCSTTVVPSPPPGTFTSPGDEVPLPRLDTSSHLIPIEIQRSSPSPLSAGLRIQTDIIPGCAAKATSNNETATNSANSTQSMRIPPQTSSMKLARTPSIKNVIASSAGSSSNLGSAPNSALSSPMLNAMADVTPLPSPLMTGDSPGPWKKLIARPASRDLMVPNTADSALVTANGESISAAIANQSKRRAYHGLSKSIGSGLTSTQVNMDKNAEGHARNRSLSEYVPENVQLPKTRNITVSGSHATVLDVTPEPPADMHMRREPHLAVQRGLASVPKPPTPPSSRTGGESSDSDSSLPTNYSRLNKKPRYEYFDAYTPGDSKRRRWRALKVLGQGTFSKVMLATSQVPEAENRADEDDVFASQMDGILTPVPEKIVQKKLVAVKICEHGPKGGASEERVEMSLKRELEIMKSIHHPSLVHLKAWNIEETRAILVLSYCPGGDLFEVASEYRDLLIPSLLRRIFSELVAAVQYLHERHIVHRDIKLENVLVNLAQHELRRTQDWAKYPHSIITLTDLGLSRRVADDEKLTTRCGSDDYAAPEVIMGQPYDGRATDAWSLGVLLYALLESRLPFDPNPGMSEGHKQRSRTSHRIARVEWRWIEYAGEEGDHEGDPEKFKERGLLGAMNVTEGLLKRARSRWTMAQVAEQEWVKGGIDLENGIRFRDEDTPDEAPNNGTIIHLPS
ncbi:serine/threonine-protein kinase-like protein [Diplocarpon rosae]|nr:serine/threonine-protein kinase-like protein [Diplocarpon rosae]